MNQPLVSIIIPCYNYDRFLTEAVKSVCAQTYANWECCIVDDGSSDNTREVSESLVRSDPRVTYHYKKNGGLSSARNYGILAAKGDYLCFLDADDLFDKEKLQQQMACFLKKPSADIVYGKAMFFEKDNLNELYHSKSKSSVSELQGFSGKGYELLRLLNNNNLTVVSTPLLKKAVFEKVGNFDESYRSYEDWHFWFRCALAGCEFIYCEQPAVCTYIRFGHESMMSDKRKLVAAGIQLRRFMASRLPARFRPYNYYRLLKLRLKLLLIR